MARLSTPAKRTESAPLGFKGNLDSHGTKRSGHGSTNSAARWFDLAVIGCRVALKSMRPIWAAKKRGCVEGKSNHGYKHEVTNVSRSEELAHELLPRVHRVVALLKRWLLGTHQGAVGKHHLDYYLDEFTFRFNRRTSNKRGKLFYRLVQQAVQVDPVFWKEVAAGGR